MNEVQAGGGGSPRVKSPYASKSKETEGWRWSSGGSGGVREKTGILRGRRRSSL